MRTRNFEKYLWPSATAALMLAVWDIAVRLTKTQVFPSPLAVASGFRELAARGVLLRYAGDSLFRVGAGYGLALALGLPTGLFLGWSWKAARDSAAARPRNRVSASSMASSGICDVTSSATWSKQARIVDSTPSGEGPSSTISSMRPSRSARRRA